MYSCSDPEVDLDIHSDEDDRVSSNLQEEMLKKILDITLKNNRMLSEMEKRVSNIEDHMRFQNNISRIEKRKSSSEPQIRSKRFSLHSDCFNHIKSISLHNPIASICTSTNKTVQASSQPTSSLVDPDINNGVESSESVDLLSYGTKNSIPSEERTQGAGSSTELNICTKLSDSGVVTSESSMSSSEGCTFIDAFRDRIPEEFKCKNNRKECIHFIQKQIAKSFSREELINGGYNDAVKTIRNKEIEIRALSPQRLGKILQSAKIMFPLEYEDLPIKRIVNEKCRNLRNYTFYNLEKDSNLHLNAESLSSSLQS